LEGRESAAGGAGGAAPRVWFLLKAFAVAYEKFDYKNQNLQIN
jgi:hypothetical protein